MAWSAKERRSLGVGLGFLAPNILGFLTFTLGPLVFSLFMALTNWNLEIHNMFHQESLRWVIHENFVRLIREQDFWHYLGNTLFLMMSIPFVVAGSLFAALLLSQRLDGGERSVWLRLVGGSCLLVSTGILILLGMGAVGMTLMVCGLAGAILISGILGGTTLYRTLFYTPHFTAGVATYILWKKMYNPHTGPINNALRPVLDALDSVVNLLPALLISSGSYICGLLFVLLLFIGLRHFRSYWCDGETGALGLVLGGILLLLPSGFAVSWMSAEVLAVSLPVLALLLTAFHVLGARRDGRDFHCRYDWGLGDALMFSGILMVGQFFLIGLSNVFVHLPDMAVRGLVPPEWLTDYYWAKPSIMIMAFWAAIGSNNMLLYLAGLSNVPQDLYEAASIDGASKFQMFWNVTWPQLAPVTFFIVVMSVIGGLQGGFEMARVMTQGGPAGSTTTLSYFLYLEGFQTGRIGFASAIGWALFALIFAVTLFNWKFGNRYVND